MQFRVIPKSDSLENKPESMLHDFDCVWVSFLEQGGVAPLKNRLLQWLDWRMQGVISRYVKEESYTHHSTTFVPTLQKQSLNYVVLDPDRPITVETFARQCMGLQARKVLLVCENESAVERLKKELTSKKLPEFAAEVHLAVGSS